MKRKISAVVLAVFLIVGSGALFQFQSEQIQNIRLKDGRLQGSFPETVLPSAKKEPVFPETESPLVLQAVSVFAEGKQIAETVYQKGLRYYLPIRLFSLQEIPETLRGESLEIDGESYLSVNDIEQALHLSTRWDYGKREIVFRPDSLKPQRQRKENAQAAMLRLEDFSAGGLLLRADVCAKYKMIADYLYQNHIPFHVAWIPRYVHPAEGMDNDLMTNGGIENVGFVNLLDHLICRGAVIGLHGYRHQFGETVSAEGIELSKDFNTSPEEIRALAEKGLQTAKYLNIPIDFFESPHYKATQSEQKILSEYFQVLYEPYHGTWNLNPLFRQKDNSVLYIPTPLGYVHDTDGSQMVRRLRLSRNTKTQLSSLYFHPFIELAYIRQEADGNSYDENSPLHHIVEALQQYGYETVTVRDFVSLMQ